MAPLNITSIKTSSDGAWQGDNPLDYAFPLLIVQTTLILVVSRSLAFLFKPLRQPKVIAEIVVSNTHLTGTKSSHLSILETYMISKLNSYMSMFRTIIK